jgi:hypothetical protein
VGALAASDAAAIGSFGDFENDLNVDGNRSGDAQHQRQPQGAVASQEPVEVLGGEAHLSCQYSAVEVEAPDLVLNMPHEPMLDLRCAQVVLWTSGPIFDPDTRVGVAKLPGVPQEP